MVALIRHWNSFFRLILMSNFLVQQQGGNKNTQEDKQWIPTVLLYLFNIRKRNLYNFVSLPLLRKYSWLIFVISQLSLFSQVTFYFAPTMLLPKKIGWYIQKSGLYDETVRRFAARISETGTALGTAMGTAV